MLGGSVSPGYGEEEGQFFVIPLFPPRRRLPSYSSRANLPLTRTPPTTLYHPTTSYKQGSKGGTLALQVDGQGNVRYDAIAQYGRKEGQTVHSSARGGSEVMAWFGLFWWGSRG